MGAAIAALVARIGIAGLIKGGAILVGALSLAGGFAWFVHHEREIGAEQCRAAVDKAVRAEQTRQTTINDYWQQWANGAAQAADKRKAKVNALQRGIALKTANSHRACLSAASVELLRSVGGAGGQAAPVTSAGGAYR